MAGWNGSQGTSSLPKQSAKTGRTSAVGRGALAGVIVVVAAALAACFVLKKAGPADTDDKSVRRPAGIAEVKPSTIKEPTGSFGDKAVGQAAREGKVSVKSGDDPQGNSPSEDQNGAVAEEKPPRPLKQAVFSNSTDQLIAMATGVADGGTIPPLPVMTAADTDRFVESLAKPIPIDEEKDSEAIKAAKRRVQAVREQIAELMRANPNKELNDILNDHRDEFNAISENQNLVRQAIQELLDEGDREGAKNLRDQMNQSLQQMGMSPVEIPVTEEEENELENEQQGENE